MPDTVSGPPPILDTDSPRSASPASSTKRSRRRILAATLSAFFVTALLGIAIVVTVESNRLHSRQKTVHDITTRIGDNIHDHLNRSLSATYALAAIIIQNDGRIENFESLAGEMLGLYGGISSLQLAPRGVISSIVPPAGNERAIGHNLLEDTKRNKEALLALNTRKLTLAGPFELIQGGRAVVGRLPVFVKAADGADRFWGFTVVLIRIPELINSANLQKIIDAGYHYEISRTDPDSGEREIFSRSSQVALRSPVKHPIEVPNGSWTLSVEPDDGWFSPLVISGECALVLLFSGLIALMVHTLYKQPFILQQMVDERTRQLSETNRQLLVEVRERERSEDALRTSQARLSESQKVARIGHYEYDIGSGLWTNSAELDAIFGIDAGYARDMRGWLQIVHPDQRAEMGDYLKRHILEHHLPFAREYRIKRISDQTERWVYGLGELELDRDGRLVKMFGTIQDITDRKRSEEERYKLEQQMQHAQKLESLGVLAGGIAHDFNNILMSILGHAELAMMRMSPASPARNNLSSIEQAAHRAADLSRQMLAYSGKGRFVLENIDLGELVTEMMHMLEVSISKCVVLRLNLAAGLPPVQIDATQVRQVLMNLVINASEAIGEKSGVISISTGAMQCDRSYLSSAWLDEGYAEGLYVYVEVADTGCGMDRDTISKIFDPFFTTKFTGRGLGMAAVLGIIRGHRGAIKIYSEPGRGTTFKILLPASSASAQPLGPVRDEACYWHGQGTILLVDDEETIRALGEEMLTMLGFSVLTADNGRRALQVFSERQNDISAVLLDLTMPHMDGEETFRELRRLKPDVRVVISSGYNEQEVCQRFLGKGLAGFIQKPFKISTLSCALKVALED